MGSKRKGEKPIPDNLEEILTPAQVLSLRQIESLGWRLQFVRRPPSRAPIPVVFGPGGRKIGVLEEDGKLNMRPDIKIRI